MPCTLTAFSVKIVASGEMAIKEAIAREVLGEWNALHASKERTAFLALDPDAPDAEPDLLLAFRAARMQGESDRDLERQLKSGRPVLIFFSEARTGLDDAGGELLQEFRKRYPSETIIESCRDEKEFRARLVQQLDAMVRYHPHFRTAAEISPTIPERHPPAPEYSKSAQALLINACDDPEAYLARTKDSRGVKIQVNGRQFVEEGNPDSVAQWNGAFDELLATGLIQEAGCQGHLFQISSKGFHFLETLGKYPIGYIAELGGM